MSRPATTESEHRPNTGSSSRPSSRSSSRANSRPSTAVSSASGSSSRPSTANNKEIDDGDADKKKKKKKKKKKAGEYAKPTGPTPEMLLARCQKKLESAQVGYLSLLDFFSSSSPYRLS
jgi:hypothetical protein